jgi:diguanylate cyclase (GGDEF)-like protein
MGASRWKSVRARLLSEPLLLGSLVATYVLAGWLGLTLSYTHPAVSVVWPAAGVATGAVVVLGYQIWPTIFAGSVALYAIVLGPAPAVVGLAAGNVVEALLAAYLVNRYAGGRHAFQNPVRSLQFAGVAIVASAIGAAPINAFSLIVTGVAMGADYGRLWLTQAVGSAVGTLLLAPAVILFSQSSSERWRPARPLETAITAVGVILIGLIVFFRVPFELRGIPGELLCTPVLLWVAFRLGRGPAVMALLAVATLAIAGTLAGYGPFVRATPLASLTVVQFFLGLTAIMTLSLAALASEYASADTQLRELVVTDPLTGLPNYRKLLDVLTTEIARADRTERPFSVVFFDMDGLKRINDEMGHLMGSRAVCRFAEVLRSACRTTDTPARYGGDEFVAVLSDTDYDGARLVVKRTAERLAGDHDQPRLSVSAGIAVYPRDGGTPTTLLSAADRALYAVKAEKAHARRRVVGMREWTSAS